MLLRYLDEVGGTLIAEVVPSSTRQPGAAKRWIDAVIMPNVNEVSTRLGKTSVYDWGMATHSEQDELRALMRNEECLVVQAKNCRLGMGLLGQALFSRELLSADLSHIVGSVALCGADTPTLSKIAGTFKTDVVVDAFAKKGKEPANLITPDYSDVDAYWNGVGLLLYRQRLSDFVGDRGASVAHAVILLDEPSGKEVAGFRSLAGRRLKLITSTNRPLGMWAMGLAVFGAQLLLHDGALVSSSVILCTKSDTALEPLLRNVAGIEVVDTRTLRGA